MWMQNNFRQYYRNPWMYPLSKIDRRCLWTKTAQAIKQTEPMKQCDWQLSSASANQEPTGRQDYSSTRVIFEISIVRLIELPLLCMLNSRQDLFLVPLLQGCFHYFYQDGFYCIVPAIHFTAEVLGGQARALCLLSLWW